MAHRDSQHLDQLFIKITAFVKSAGPTGVKYSEIQRFIVENLQHMQYDGVVGSNHVRHVVCPMMKRLERSMISKNKDTGNYVHALA